MADTFKSGVRNIPADVEEFNVTGLSLDFTPSSVQVSVRQPQADADIISAHVAGSITRDGFKVLLSSPCAVTGYILDFTVFSTDVGPTPVQGETLVVDYSSLKSKVSFFLGYNPSSLTTEQAAKVDDIIQSGIRRYYYPPQMAETDSSFEWSFLRQQGSLTTEANVSNYLMPNGFSRVAGHFTYVGDDSGEMSVPVIPFGDVKRMTESRPDAKGKPRVAAVAATNEFGTRGMKSRIYFFPVPDKAYTLSYRCDADQSKISASNPFPLGGVMFSELIIESCLAVAEQTMNDEIGIHTQNFNSLLASSVQRDRKSSAQVFGRIGDPHHRRFW